MYVRASTRRNKTGQVVRYLQLAHNEWDAAAGASRTKILYSFGREDQLDRAAIERLIGSLTRLLDPAAAAALSRPGGPGVHRVPPVRRHPRARRAVAPAGHRHRDRQSPGRAAGRDATRIERVLFALVANRALAPSSKLAAADWITHDVHIDGLPETSRRCLLPGDGLAASTSREQLAREVFHQVANLLNLEVDLLFFDTTSTYFELEDPDEPVARDDHGHRPARPRRRRRTDGAGESDGQRTGSGSGPTASRRTPATTCRRS